MSSRTPTPYRRLKWRLEWLVFLTIETLIRLLSPGRAARVGAVLGRIMGRLLKSRRRVVERNLRIAFAGEKTADELAALRDEVFVRAGANLIASLRTSTLAPEQLHKAIDIENPELMHELVSSDKGVVVLLAHMGNWEALAQKFPQMLKPGKTATMYRPLNNPLLDARVVATRKRTGLVSFAKGGNALALSSFLRDGGSLGIISDQRAAGIGETVPFFGRLTACTPLPAVLARRTGAEIAALSVRTRSPGKWTIKLHRLTGEPTTEACMALLETVMRESPADVFWLQDRWKVNRTRPQSAPGKLARGETTGIRATKARRCLVWLTSTTVAPAALQHVEPNDLAYEYCLPAGAARPTWLATDAVIHTGPEGSDGVENPETANDTLRGISRRQLTESLIEIDARAALPIEFVYAPGGDKRLVKAGRDAGLVVITKPEGGT